jgi:hypothetical protein
LGATKRYVLTSITIGFYILVARGPARRPVLRFGSILLAAKILGRRFVGIELDAAFCHQAQRRLAGGRLRTARAEPEGPCPFLAREQARTARRLRRLTAAIAALALLALVSAWLR